jgi:hypothetical protein
VEAENVGFTFARQIVAVRRTVTKLDGTPVSAHVRHWITSLEIDDSRRPPSQLLDLCRGHWSVENKNHWKRDAIWNEDTTRVQAPAIARNLALLRSVLLAPLARSGYPSLPATLETMARDPAQAIRLIQNQRLT